MTHLVKVYGLALVVAIVAASVAGSALGNVLRQAAESMLK